MAIVIQRTQQGGWERITLVGVLNEDAEADILKLAPTLGSKVIINFRGVQSVNSCGVNAWIKFIRAIDNGRSLVYEECTPDIVTQINMTHIFRGSAVINSLYADYQCRSCGHAQSHLFVRGKNLPQSSGDGVEAVACAKCGKTTEMDEVEEEYFACIDT